MAARPEDFASRLAAARSGSGEALGQMLDACRGYLHLVAKAQLAPSLGAKVSPSDLVQDSFLEAHRDFAQFRGESEAAFLAWLRQLLLNNLANVTRHFQGTAKRSLSREMGLAEGSTVPSPAEGLPSDLPSPSEHAIAREQAEALEHALEHLPGDYREVLLLRYLEERSFEEIGVLMQRTSNAVRKLWARAVERLQQDLEGPA